MEMWEKIAAGLLAATMSIGAANATANSSYRDRSAYSSSVGSAANISYTPSQRESGHVLSNGVSQAYTNELLNWLDSTSYGNNNSLKNIFRSNISASDKYLFALAFYDSFSGKSGGHKVDHKADPGDEMVYLVPHETSDGSFQYVNRMTGRVEVMINKMPNGLFSYYGPVKWITRLGGRNELGGIRDSMADGKFFNKG